MRIFLIDFENVHSEGIAGVEHLGENDEIVIFYSPNADTLSFELMQKLHISNAKLSYYKIRRGGKNALDFQLSSYLGYLLSTRSKDEIFIVSKDAGFDFLLDFWTGGYIDGVPPLKRFTSLKSVLQWENGRPEKGTALSQINEDAEEAIEEIANADEIVSVILEEKPKAAKPARAAKPVKAAEPVKAPAKKRGRPSKKAAEIVEPASVAEEVAAPAPAPVAEKPKARRGRPSKKAVEVAEVAENAKPIEAVEEAAVAVQGPPSDEEVAFINTLIQESKGLQSIYVALTKKYKQQRGVELYNYAKKRIAEVKQALKSSAEPEKTEAAVAAASEPVQPKKRGRKPKAAAAAASEPVQPKKRGRKPKADKAKPADVRRGRPRKSQPDSEPIVLTLEEQEKLDEVKNQFESRTQFRTLCNATFGRTRGTQIYNAIIEDFHPSGRGKAAAADASENADVVVIDADEVFSGN
ncbi:MAG: hypothetical protein LBN40_04015 [Oscillospiraceae bacterium]|jgi:hypothetical protein|nr:hypothetical protein [Oscillospiraceae bacterium]